MTQLTRLLLIVPAVVLTASFAAELTAATTTTWEPPPSISGVSQVVPKCTAPVINCRTADLKKVSCPRGQTPIRVEVTLGPLNMSSNVNAVVPDDAEAGCYNIEKIDHKLLRLRIPGITKLDLNGGSGCGVESGVTGTAGGGNVPPCGNVPPWNNTNPPLLWFGNPGDNIAFEGLCATNRASFVKEYFPTDDEWTTFYGDESETFLAEFTAQADRTVSESASWGSGLITPASGTLTVTAICRTPSSNGNGHSVPAIGAVGVGVAALGLAGIGVLFGFRRRP